VSENLSLFHFKRQERLKEREREKQECHLRQVLIQKRTQDWIQTNINNKKKNIIIIWLQWRIHCTWTRTRSSDLKEQVQSCTRRRRIILKKKLLAFMETIRYWRTRRTRRSSDLPCMGRIWRCPDLGKKKLEFWAFSLWEPQQQQQQQGGLILGAWVQSEWWVVFV
jgi:hypothetical protein